jgi:hypothetical protein
MLAYRTKVGEDIAQGEAALCAELGNNAESGENFKAICTFENPFQIALLRSDPKIIQNN